VNFLIALRYKGIVARSHAEANQIQFPRYHVGQSIFISICRDEDRKPIIDIRHFNNSLPGKRGVQLNTNQTKELLAEKCVERKLGMSNGSIIHLLKD
jgi:hypothetical protein